ncbi:ACR127Wp [Eremothecium gossypii ATCC 10895]|uniref:ACR127Wp n=1 Tax=Eremothecium gossypii (strain ATCC 10895 / CBS 109.51 / FGSC 9923 / NRRL Y-1056) TaxID=284811 RepID=Q75BZ2_EREGS|nr:ACR127Wp [Eremothecium gossypii ATCC 10895]AAS51353.1 ACR127Wp [Eremothecium gossypii ATCC 10895]AEY95644.1 FACR127Wp [Eremothecium gossypii FDAG1]
MVDLRPKQLIVVPCHSIWRQSSDTAEENLGQKRSHWHLAEFQHEGNDHLAFIKHALIAIETLIASLDVSIVIFSGGKTKAVAGEVSEASSYFYLTKKLLQRVQCGKSIRWAFPDAAEIPELCQKIIGRLHEKAGLSVDALFAEYVHLEEFALDSFDNLLYSIGRFKEITSVYPSNITIIGFGFKKRRFIEYHARAIDFPTGQINYIEVEPTPSYDDPVWLKNYFETLRTLEHRNALALFQKDWYATREPLASKKSARNPFNESHQYPLPLPHLESPDFQIENDATYYNASIKSKMPWSQ